MTIKSDSIISTSLRDPQARDALFRIKRGLCGYISYLAACGMNAAFSEYVLYEPILRILDSREFIVRCEFPCPGIDHPKRGDRKRLDFYATGDTCSLALEVKWVKSKKPNVARDTAKLKAFAKARPKAFPLLCVFGTKSNIGSLELPEGQYREWGKPVYADFRKTIYGCRVFRLVA